MAKLWPWNNKSSSEEITTSNMQSINSSDYLNHNENKSNSDTNSPNKNKPAPGLTKLTINKNSLKNFLVKAVGFVTYQNDRENFSRPEYNLAEIKEAAEADSYVKISLSKYSYLIYKAGFKLHSENQAAVDYLNMRFKMMSFSTGKPTEMVFQEVADDLTTYSNAFLLKSRVNAIPGIKAKPVFNDKIIGGYFRIDPASIKIKRDKHGNILKYEQGRGDNVKVFSPDDVIHIYMDKDANNAFGTPRIIAALEDIKLLRKIEGNVTALIHRFSMPLYQWKIGIPEIGFQGTDEEIRKAQREVESSTLDGLIITNEKTEIKAIGAEGNALDATNYLTYFENRCFAALGTSASQMGRGGAKQDSESMEAQVHDTVKYIQRVISIFTESKILIELLLEGGFNPISDPNDEVKYLFEEISLETKIKKENHEVLKYQSNLTSFEETRRRVGLKDDVKDEDKLYKNYIETNSRIKEIDQTAKHQMELAKFNADTQKEIQKSSDSNKNISNSSSSNKNPRSSKDSGPSKEAENNNRPKNQHGTHSVKIKELSESLDIDNKSYHNEFSNLKSSYKELKDAVLKDEDIDLLFPLIKEDMVEIISEYIHEYSLNGSRDAIRELNRLHKTSYGNYNLTEEELKDFYEEANKDINNLLNDIKSEVITNRDNISEYFENVEYRLRFFTDFIIRKTYWYSFIRTGNATGIKDAYIIFNSENDNNQRNDKINTDNFGYDDIPAYHSFCNCNITFNKEKYKRQVKKIGNRN